MRLMVILPAVAGLMLAACEAQTPATPSGREAPSTPATSPAPTSTPAGLGGVDLTGGVSVLGTEPFWNVTFDGSEITYTGLDRPTQVAPRGEPTLSGQAASWTAQTDAGNALVVTLTVEECSDGMSDRTYPLSAEVVIAGETLHGCAASTAWLNSVDETGQPRQG